MILPASEPSIWLLLSQGILHLWVEQSFCQDECVLDIWFSDGTSKFLSTIMPMCRHTLSFWSSIRIPRFQNCFSVLFMTCKLYSLFIFLYFLFFILVYPRNYWSIIDRFNKQYSPFFLQFPTTNMSEHIFMTKERKILEKPRSQAWLS